MTGRDSEHVPDSLIFAVAPSSMGGEPVGDVKINERDAPEAMVVSWLTRAPQVATLKGGDFEQVKDPSLSDVAPLSMGLGSVGDVMIDEGCVDVESVRPGVEASADASLEVSDVVMTNLTWPASDAAAWPRVEEPAEADELNF